MINLQQHHFTCVRYRNAAVMINQHQHYSIFSRHRVTDENYRDTAVTDKSPATLLYIR
jgi:hypothetical protein